ncbi:GGDEF domain-containing protein [Pseudoalteromonas mariniglutinosa]|uniref:GGDEF domain-containing protein n=1 Tax=Pseudoalteromonas mariniglutinosa TaxID=206042 RepID=UPI003850F073
MTVDDVPVPALLVCAERISRNAQFSLLPAAVQVQVSDISQQFNLNSRVFYKTIELRLQQHIYTLSLKKNNTTASTMCCVFNSQASEQRSIDDLVFNHSGEAMMVTDKDDDIIRVNDAFILLFGYQRDRVLFHKPTFLRSGLNQSKIIRAAFRAIKKEGHWSGEIMIRKASGETIHTWQSTSAITHNDEVKGFITIFSDISNHISQRDTFRFLAYHDHLTGLPNRLLLEDRFKQVLKHFKRKRDADTNTLSIVFIDLNQFKELNDQFGHQAGDDALKILADVFQHTLREDDTAARLGGDEFVLLLEHFNSLEQVHKLTTRIANALEHAVANSDYPQMKINFSYGAAFYPKNGESLDVLIEMADKKMYKMKNANNH